MMEVFYLRSIDEVLGVVDAQDPREGSSQLEGRSTHSAPEVKCNGVWVFPCEVF